MVLCLLIYGVTSIGISSERNVVLQIRHLVLLPIETISCLIVIILVLDSLVVVKEITQLVSFIDWALFS